MSRRTRGRPQEGGGCGGCLVALVILVIIGAGAFALAGAELTRLAGGLLGGQGVSLPAPAPDQPPPALATAGAQADALLPTAVAALPAGEVAVSEAQINAAVAAQAAELGIEGAQVRITGGEIIADISAAGTRSTFRGGLVAEGGRVAIVNPRLDGPLAIVTSAESLATTLEGRLNAELASQGRAIQSVRVEEGRIVAVIQ